MPEHRWQEILELLAGAEIARPGPDAPFDRDLIPGHVDGDWPEWPAREMLKWMPAELLTRFGRTEASVLNGDYLRIDPRHEAALAAALEGAGWTCIKDDALVSAASGYGYPTGSGDSGS